MAVEEITDENFAEKTGKGLVLCDLWAVWCGPCKMESPILDKLSEKRKDVKFVKLNVDENQKIPTKLNIKAIPTMLIKKDGKIVERLTGFTPLVKLNAILDKYAK